MEYETLKCEYIEYGRNKFIEVSRKKAMPDENEFLNISKGYYRPDGERRYNRGIGFPVNEEIVKSLIEKIQQVAEGAAATSSEADSPE
ncbi:Uncharacterised protein [uncultured archaeon]|nr:Uncharacterised protein [uncultured archaeon]